jgi:hypothetical protein
MYYMVGGSSKKNQDVGEKWLTEHPKVLTLLVFLVSKVQILAPHLVLVPRYKY